MDFGLRVIILILIKFYLNIYFICNHLILFLNHYLFSINHLYNLWIHIYLYCLILFSLFMTLGNTQLEMVDI